MTNATEGGALGDNGGAVVTDKGEKLDMVSYDSHQKLLKQKKKADERARELESKLEAIQLEKQKAEGNKDAVIANLEDKLEKTERREKEFLRNMTKKSLKSEITKTAISKGIQPEKLDLFLELAEKDFLNDESQIQVDENFEIVNRDDFESVFEQRATKVSDWFTKSVDQPGDVVPSRSGLKVPQKSLKDMDIDELAELL